MLEKKQLKEKKHQKQNKKDFCYHTYNKLSSQNIALNPKKNLSIDHPGTKISFDLIKGIAEETDDSL